MPSERPQRRGSHSVSSIIVSIAGLSIIASHITPASLVAPFPAFIGWMIVSGMALGIMASSLLIGHSLLVMMGFSRNREAYQIIIQPSPSTALIELHPTLAEHKPRVPNCPTRAPINRHGV